MDPSTLQVSDISAPVYWRAPFESLATVSDLVEFVVLDVEPSGPTRGKFVLADAQVALNAGFQATGQGGMDVDEQGSTDDVYHTRTHLGGILQPGDVVLGYYLSRSNFNNDAFDTLDSGRIPDVILIKKTYPTRRKKNKSRNWRLKSIAKEAEETGQAEGAGRGALGRRGGLDQERVEKDYELFLRDLEEDPELRSTVNLYKADAVMTDVQKKPKSGPKKSQYAMDVEEGPSAKNTSDVEEEEETNFPEIKIEELLDTFEDMKLNEGDQ